MRRKKRIVAVRNEMRQRGHTAVRTVMFADPLDRLYDKAWGQILDTLTDPRLMIEWQLKEEARYE